MHRDTSKNSERKNQIRFGNDERFDSRVFSTEIPLILNFAWKRSSNTLFTLTTMRLPASMPSLAWLTTQGWLSMFHGDTEVPKHRPGKIGLALSCGGARGLAHIGVIQVLEREG